MSYIRSDGMGFPDPEQDAVIQTIIGDLKRLRLMIERGADSSAYVRRDQALTDLKNPEAAMQQVLQQYISSTGGFPPSGTLVASTTYGGGASGTHVCNTATTHVVIFCSGAGGGGGDGWIASGPTGYFGGGGGGGGAGAWAHLWGSVSGGASIPYSVGSGGSGGGSSDGSDGADTTVTLGSFTTTAGGGKKGLWADASTTAGLSGQGGLGGQVGASLTLNPLISHGSGCNGCNGTMAYMFNAGPPPLFNGAGGLGGVGNGGYGAGGAGAYYASGSLATSGSDGVVIIAEYTAS